MQEGTGGGASQPSVPWEAGSERMRKELGGGRREVCAPGAAAGGGKCSGGGKASGVEV